MARQLTEKQQKFLDVLFEEAKGNPVTAKKLAGYSENNPTSAITSSLQEEIADLTKKFIASTSRYLVFENNTSATRNRFLSSVNPYMESVQEKNGLYAFKVVMDDTNNTPDIIDRNIMKGEIFLQPAKAAEFIVIDFNIMPTGATFED